MPTNPLTYPKVAEQFNLALFQNPSAEYRGAPLWSWNTKLDKDILFRQIDHFKEMGMGGFHMHSRVGLDTEYMGPKFMKFAKACVEYAAEKGMLAYLYDEDRWPSGGAGGFVTKGHPEFETRHLLLTPAKYGERPIAEPMAFTAFPARSGKGKLIARYDISLEDGRLASVKRLKPSEDGKNVFYAYIEPNLPSEWFNGETYVDTLSKPAISRFIEITHERYKNELKDYFGGVIPSIFTDEPQFAHKTQLLKANSLDDIFLPWSLDLTETFQKTYGYDLLDHLPEVVWNLPENGPSLARYHFHDHVCERFVEAFMDQLAGWCRNNGIALTGHMMEEPFLDTQAKSLGEAMRCYRSLDLPGIDILCDQYEYNTAKQAVSVARQNGARGTMSEIYGVTNWTFNFEGHKGCGDWQAALGITFRVHHLTWVTMAGEAKRDFPACIGYQSPWYKEYSYVEDYFSRINVALTRGKSVTRVAVIHPIESFWLCLGPVDSGRGEIEYREQCFRDLTHWLLHGLVDFDFISESLFPSQTPEDKIGKTLPVGHSEYDVVIVPNLWTIRSTTLSRLRKFQQAGGVVLVAGSSPTLVDAVKTKETLAIEGSVSVPWTKYHILSALNSFRDIRIVASTGSEVNSLLYQVRKDSEEEFVFVCNTDRLNFKETIVSIRGCWKVQVLDAFTGKEWELRATKQEGWTVFPYVFEGCASLLLHLTPGSSTDIANAQFALSQKFKALEVVTLKSVELSEPNVLVLDFAEYKLEHESSWSPLEEVLRIDNITRVKLQLPAKLDAFRQPWSIPLEDRKPKASLKLRFTVDSSIDIPSPTLALENASDISISVNGNSVPSKIVGWWVDEDIKTVALPTLKSGATTIELTYPFGLMTNIERVYLLGNFGVDLRGRKVTLVPLDMSKITFGDYTVQGLPFYVGNVIYNCSFILPPTHSGLTALEVRQFIAPLLTVSINGHQVGRIAFEPRMLLLPFDLIPGEHALSITSFGNRENAFGTIHLPDGMTTWFGPNEFRTDRPGWWMNEYNVKRMGIISAPNVMVEGKTEVKVQPHILRYSYERASQRI